DAALAQELFDSFVGRARFHVRPHAGAIRVNAHVSHRANAMRCQEAGEFIGQTASIADCVELGWRRRNHEFHGTWWRKPLRLSGSTLVASKPICGTIQFESIPGNVSVGE